MHPLRARAAALMAGMLLLATQAQAQLFGVTNDSLYRLDATNGATPALVGSLNLPSSYLTAALAYHSASHNLVVLAYDAPGGSVVNQYLLSVNPETGATAPLVTLGAPSSVGYFEALEYVNSRGSLVVSNGGINDFTTLTLRDVSLDGVLGPAFVNTGVDNDMGVYDSSRDILYVADPNGAGRLIRTDPIVDLGAIPLFGDPAYDPAADAFYAVNFTTNALYRFTTDGLAPVTISDLGFVGGSPGAVPIINALAVVPEPSAALLCAPLAALLRRRR